MPRAAAALALALACATLAAPPRVDWSAFPEGVTELRVTSVDDRAGGSDEVVYTVTRSGAAIALDVRERHERKMRAGPTPESAQRFSAPKLSEPARDADGRARSLDCRKEKVLVHSSDLSFDPPPGAPECDGSFWKARSRSPRHVDALSCVLAIDGKPDGGAPLTFVPGKTVESFAEDTGCAKRAGLRFPAAQR